MSDGTNRSRRDYFGFFPNSPPSPFFNSFSSCFLPFSICSLAAFCAAREARLPMSSRTTGLMLDPVIVAGTVTRPFCCV